MFNFSQHRAIRRPSLTPMIDVVFLLLVFFMLAARFSQDIAVPLSAAGTTSEPDGPPRLVTLSGQDVSFNGIPLTPDTLVARLAATGRPASDPVFVQPVGEARLQQLVMVIDTLRAAGYTSIVVVGQP